MFNQPTSDAQDVARTPKRRRRARGQRGRPSADSISSLIVEGFTLCAPIKCMICTRIFPREKSLQAHMRTHTGERPYRCLFDGCQKSFAQSGQLKTHQRLHTGEKPFICNVEGCFSRFTHANRHCLYHPDAPLRRESTQIVQSKQPATRRQNSAENLQQEDPIYRERHPSVNSIENEWPVGMLESIVSSSSAGKVSSPVKMPLGESREQSVASNTVLPHSFLQTITTARLEHKFVLEAPSPCTPSNLHKLSLLDSGFSDINSSCLMGGNPVLSSVVEGSPYPPTKLLGHPLLFSTPVRSLPLIRQQQPPGHEGMSSLSFKCEEDVACDLGVVPLGETPTKQTPENSQVIHLEVNPPSSSSCWDQSLPAIPSTLSKSLLEQRLLWSPEKTSAPKYKKLLAKRRMMEEKARKGAEANLNTSPLVGEREYAALALVKLAQSPPHPAVKPHLSH